MASLAGKCPIKSEQTQTAQDRLHLRMEYTMLAIQGVAIGLWTSAGYFGLEVDADGYESGPTGLGLGLSFENHVLVA